LKTAAAFPIDSSTASSTEDRVDSEVSLMLIAVPIGSNGGIIVAGVDAGG